MYTKTRAELRKTLDEIKSAGLYKQERLLDSPRLHTSKAAIETS